VLVIARDAESAQQRFGVTTGESGVCLTRTGRRFFDDRAVERQLLDRVRAAADGCDFWARFETDWMCLDAELMPWSAKAQDLLRTQYAAVGSAAISGLAESISALDATQSRGIEVGALLADATERQACAQRYVAAYRRYCWPVKSVEDLRLAPFHLLATEGRVHSDRDHVWHMSELDRLTASGGVLQTTRRRLVELEDESDARAGIAWWEELTSAGGEGMVVKPFDFVVRGRRGLVQPAVKCRGPEYLRIIYGPEYDRPQNLARLRNRSVARKRSLALRELALGIESLERFVRREPLRRVHECVFGVLALESDPVDPRL
jgi:protein phosphatase